MTARKLLYVTLSFPGDLYSEKAFIDPELQALRARFDEIVLVPTDLISTQKGYEAALPDNVTADWTLARDRIYSSRLLKLPYAFHPEVLRALWNMRTEAHTPRQWLKGMFQASNMVRASRIIRKIARAHNMSPDDTILYSMWFADPAAALARLARKQGWKMATRAHTSDLYDDRMLFRSRRLRNSLLRNVSFVFTISEKGANYMKQRYPEAARRIIHHPLGALRLAPEHVAPSPRHPDAITFVTTARLDPVKELALIFGTLEVLAASMPRKEFKWTLFGDGPCLEALQKRARCSRVPNFHVEFMGATPNAAIQEYYARKRPDWFIMMSRSEGIPISMGEAMAHSIPVITTDVGDVSELVDSRCAVLLPAPRDYNGIPTLFSRDYARILAPLIVDNSLRESMAAEAFRRWSSAFDASRLADRTATLLASLLP